MRLGFAFGQNLFLQISRQLDVAMTVAVNVHKHGSSHKKGIFMNAGILPFGDARQRENTLSKFLV